MRRVLALALVSACGCASPGIDARRGADAAPADARAPEPDARDAWTLVDAVPAVDGPVPVDAASPLDVAPPLPPARSCAYRSTTFDAAMLELDADPSSATRLRFEVADVPAPALVDRATLVFESYDADHPGDEGVVTLNGAGPFPIPAMSAWDNAAGTGSIDVTGTLVPGTNRIEFGPGPLPRSFFRIGAVRLDLEVRIDACAPPPTSAPVERRLHFHEGTFTNRATWVVPCPPGHPRFAAIRDYAFTASGAEHEPTDCDGLYRAGSGERGTATYVFDAVTAATYGIYVSFRTSGNRNPRGALFVVNGEERRIDQVDASGAFREVLWGERALAGMVTVVLDSSREAESDSVTEIRLVPR